MMYQDKPKQESRSGTAIAPPPTKCCVDACQNDTDVKMILVRDGTGKNRIGVMRDFGYVDKEGTHYLFGNYVLMGWITRCCAHYVDDVKRSNKNQLKIDEGDHSYMLNKPHSERMIVLRNLVTKCFKELPYDKESI